MIERETLAALVDERVIPPPFPAGLADTLSCATAPRADRIVGALVGCALGDALGRPNESRSAHGRTRIEQFDPRLAGISDDTQLTIEIARNLVEHGGAFEPVGFGEQLVAWLPRAVGIGRATRAAVLRLRDGEPWYAAGTPSAGNGAAMRVAPIGLAHAGNLDRLRLDAAVSALPTHHDPTAAASSVAMAYAVAWCAAVDSASFDPGQFLADIGAVVADLVDPGVTPRQPGVEGRVTMASVIEHVGDRLDMAPADYFATHWSGALVTESLPAALWCLARSPDDPLEAMRPAAELARDADTVAAMAGTLAGALHGRSGLPAHWVAMLPGEVVDELEALGRSVASLGSGRGERTDRGARAPEPVGGDRPLVSGGPGARDGRDRAIGALLGLACGDAVGTTLEFRPPGSFTPIEDMVGGGPFHLQPGEWTDDTSMALCLAESLLDRGDLDPGDQMRRYLLWWRAGYLSSNGRCFDIGNTVSSQLARYERTGGAIDPEPAQTSAANGSLMRLAAVPIRWHTDVSVAAGRSAESSRTTHGARRPVNACRVLGAMIAALVDGQPADEVFDPELRRWGDLDPEIASVAGGSWQAKSSAQVRGTGFCVDALEAAIWAVAGANDFRDAVLRAANLGDDADTTGAIAGQLAGARWGASGVAADWRDKLVLRDRIEALASGLYDAARAAGPDGVADLAAPAPSSGTGERSPWPHDAFLHGWWVGDRVLAGEYPGDHDPHLARQRIDLLADAGIRTFVDLTTRADGLSAYADLVAAVVEARRLDLRHHRRPIPDLGVIDDTGYDEIVALIAMERRRGGVYVHCWGGVGRTGTVVGCLLLHDGIGGGDVVERLAELRAGTRKADRPCPETQAQVDVLRRRLT